MRRKPMESTIERPMMFRKAFCWNLVEFMAEVDGCFLHDLRCGDYISVITVRTKGGRLGSPENVCFIPCWHTWCQQRSSGRTVEQVPFLPPAGNVVVPLAPRAEQTLTVTGALRPEMFDEISRPAVVVPKVSKKPLALPPGFADSQKKTVASVGPQKRSTDVEDLKMKKAWEIAVAPAKSIPMNAFMSYMTGNSLQMIPIMMSFSLFWNPVKAIFIETNVAFSSLRTDKNSANIMLAQVVFVICQVAAMMVGLYKFYKMGLLPTAESDWLAWKTPMRIKELCAVNV